MCAAALLCNPWQSISLILWLLILCADRVHHFGYRSLSYAMWLPIAHHSGFCRGLSVLLKNIQAQALLAAEPVCHVRYLLGKFCIQLADGSQPAVVQRWVSALLILGGCLPVVCEFLSKEGNCQNGFRECDPGNLPWIPVDVCLPR